jgi:hypothetical protein
VGTHHEDHVAVIGMEETYGDWLFDDIMSDVLPSSVSASDQAADSEVTMVLSQAPITTIKLFCEVEGECYFDQVLPYRSELALQDAMAWLPPKCVDLLATDSYRAFAQCGRDEYKEIDAALPLPVVDQTIVLMLVKLDSAFPFHPSMLQPEWLPSESASGFGTRAKFS